MNVGLNAPRYEKYALLYTSSPSLQKALCDYYSTIVELCTRIVLFLKKPAVKQVASALHNHFTDTFGIFQKDLVDKGTIVKEELLLSSKQLQHFESVEGARERKENSLFRSAGTSFRKETAAELAGAKKWREDRFKAQFLNACSTYDHESSLSQARKKGASTWIFEKQEYQKWMATNSSSTLLCSGIVGAGKTVLSASIIETLSLTKPYDSSLGYFFCRSDESLTLKAREVLGNLALQLFKNIPSASFKSIQAKFNDNDRSLSTEQILSSMRLLLPPRSYTIILDGVDECEFEEAMSIFDRIRSLMNDCHFTLKLFFTCRTDFTSRISKYFKPEI